MGRGIGGDELVLHRPHLVSAGPHGRGAARR
jgi:hypothetical protein